MNPRWKTEVVFCHACAEVADRQHDDIESADKTDQASLTVRLVPNDGQDDADEITPGLHPD